MSFFHEAIERYECGACFGVIEAPGMSPLSTIQCPHCQVTTHVPARFGKYIIWESMRPDALFDVYLAQDTLLERAVALILVPNDNPKLRDRCLNDARRLAGLSHNWVSQIYEAACVDDQWYVASEFVSTRSALHLIAEKELILEEEALYWLKGLVSGLNDCFTHQVSMFRIRPSRLMLSPSAGLKILDLGSDLGLKQDQGYYTKPGRYYAAPEVLAGHKPTIRSSIFSMAASIYHMLAGAPPFPDGPLACTKGTSQSIKRLTAARPDLSEDFRLVLKRMLKRKPAERYGSAQQVLHDLEQLLPDDHVVVNPNQQQPKVEVSTWMEKVSVPTRPPEHWSHRVHEDTMQIEQAAATVTSLRALDIVAPSRKRGGGNTISTADLLVESANEDYSSRPGGLGGLIGGLFGSKRPQPEEGIYTASLDELEGEDSDQNDHTSLEDVVIDGPRTVRRHYNDYRNQPKSARRKNIRRRRKKQGNPRHMIITYLLIGINTVSLLLILGSTTLGRKDDDQNEETAEADTQVTISHEEEKKKKKKKTFKEQQSF